MPELRSRPLFRIDVTLHPYLDVGATPLGRRRIALVSGGTFEGDRLKGTVLPHGGSDWILQRTDDSFQLDVRMMLQTDDGALIGKRYAWINHVIAVGMGDRRTDGVVYDVFEVL